MNFALLLRRDSLSAVTNVSAWPRSTVKSASSLYHVDHDQLIAAIAGHRGHSGHALLPNVTGSRRE